jgi:DNA-binding CsgD family transcriptional regulator
MGALVAAHRDDRAALESHLAVLTGWTPPLRGPRVDNVSVVRALTAEQAGQFGEATEVLAAFVRQDEDRPADHERQFVLPTLVRLALAAGDRGIAEWATALCGRDAAHLPGPYASAAARHCQGLLDANPADLRAAVDGFRAIGDVPALADSLENLAVVYGQRGEVQAARAAYAEAVELYQGMGAAACLARAWSRVRPYGVGGGPRGAPSRPASGWYALTPTERGIAHLVAAGLSNPDIATELFLSRRTVQSHVSHILTKLHVQSRAEIAQRVAEHAPGGTGEPEPPAATTS